MVNFVKYYFYILLTITCESLVVIALMILNHCRCHGIGSFYFCSIHSFMHKRVRKNSQILSVKNVLFSRLQNIMIISIYIFLKSILEKLVEDNVIHLRHIDQKIKFVIINIF